MTATELDLAVARGALNALGLRLDQQALARADETALDGVLAAMQQIHDSIIKRLTAAS